MNPNIFIDDNTLENIARALWIEKFDATKIPAELLSKINSAKNSNHAFAERFNKRLEKLIDDKLSYTASYLDRYKIMMENSSLLSPQQCYTRSLFLGPESVIGYEKIKEKPDFIFPNIDAPQLKNQVGWHFFVGNFCDANHHYYSVQFMLWQYALLPPDLAAECELSDIENQIVEMHIGISDQKNNIHYRSTPIVVAGTTGLIQFDEKPFSYRFGKNGITSTNQQGDLFPATITAKGWDFTNENEVEISLSISLINQNGYFLEGEEGCAPSIDGLGTLYYSASHLTLNSENENAIELNNQKIILTDGRMWYDHQWGTGFMPAGATEHAEMRALQNLKKPAPGGWDWFMIHFNQNSLIAEQAVEITISALHTLKNACFYNVKDTIPPGVMKANFDGKYIDNKDPPKNIYGTMTVTEWVKSNTSCDAKNYQPTFTWYPAKFSFSVASDIPNAIKNFTLIPFVSTGQTGFFANGLQYSEGGVTVKNKEGDEIGYGFAESTNYAFPLEDLLTLAGLPITENTLPFFKAPKISLIKKIGSFILVLFSIRKVIKIFKRSKGIFRITR